MIEYRPSEYPNTLCRLNDVENSRFGLGYTFIVSLKEPGPLTKIVTIVGIRYF